MSLPLHPADTQRDAKLKALGEFAAGAGHEINNPVATISGYVQQLLRDEIDPDRIQMLLTIGAQAHRIRDMIGDAMLFARPPQPRPQPQNLRLVAQEVIDKFTEEAKSRGCTVEITPGEELPILADPTQVRVLLSALVRNALEASQAEGRIVLEGGQFVDGRGAFARFLLGATGRPRAGVRIAESLAHRHTPPCRPESRQPRGPGRAVYLDLAPGNLTPCPEPPRASQASSPRTSPRSTLGERSSNRSCGGMSTG
ncbi:MAG: HAMP domain-containing sensor histidine kinase [Planctomycetota bacterium]|nr:HAMP domain-containing sensor histidine kinase [Planctomycetota bacterium]